ncbi:hypothetical protein [Metabacillus niabensis]|uniref:Uncharacterized protein n=1 Tax=Metabacillus niabensis TaxID=324854 RepID=A0ABT9Z1J9_9BACI|nr:hypothetical protein [Metabacillus niabensis]MDQ0226119.1 hypothetical protein [Metabacillus niabensis]
MALETLPNWFWAIYYFILITTLAAGIYSIFRNKIRALSVLTIIFSLTVPIISFFNSIGRGEGMNEFEHFISQLQQGTLWSIYTIIGYIFIVVWWVLFLVKGREKVY